MRRMRKKTYKVNGDVKKRGYLKKSTDFFKYLFCIYLPIKVVLFEKK